MVPRQRARMRYSRRIDCRELIEAVKRQSCRTKPSAERGPTWRVECKLRPGRRPANASVCGAKYARTPTRTGTDERPDGGRHIVVVTDSPEPPQNFGSTSIARAECVGIMPLDHGRHPSQLAIEWIRFRCFGADPQEPARVEAARSKSCCMQFRCVSGRIAPIRDMRIDFI